MLLQTSQLLALITTKIDGDSKYLSALYLVPN